MLRPTTAISLLAAFTAMALPSMVQGDLPIYGLNYSPRSGPDWTPETRCKSVEAIRSDLMRLKEYTNRLRFFSNVDCDLANSVVPIAHELGFEMSLGMWVNADKGVFLGEKNKLEEMISNYRAWFDDRSVFRDIHVGSEAIYREELTAEENIELMNEVKALLIQHGISMPVTISEIGDVYGGHPKLVRAVDFVMANAFPFWEKHPVEGAAAQFKQRMADVLGMADEYGKKFEVGETGWATAGSHKNASEASPENAAKYFSEFTALADENEWPYYYFTSFDDDWKEHYDAESGSETVETHFGIFEADGTLKPEYAGVIQDRMEEEDGDSMQDGNTGKGNKATDDETNQGVDDTPADSDFTTAPPTAVDPASQMNGGSQDAEVMQGGGTHNGDQVMDDGTSKEIYDTPANNDFVVAPPTAMDPATQMDGSGDENGRRLDCEV